MITFLQIQYDMAQAAKVYENTVNCNYLLQHVKEGMKTEQWWVHAERQPGHWLTEETAVQALVVLTSLMRIWSTAFRTYIL